MYPMREEFARQFDCALDILAEAIVSFRPETWVAGKAPYDGPARAGVHALQCGRFFTSGDKEIWNNLGKPVWEMSDQELPSQQETVGYLEEVREEIHHWLDRLEDEELDASVDFEHARTRFELLLYAMRHLQHHIGELCAYQKKCGLAPAIWK